MLECRRRDDDWVVVLGANLHCPPLSPGVRRFLLLPAFERVQLLRLLLRITHHLGDDGNTSRPQQRRPRRASISWQARTDEGGVSRRPQATRPPPVRGPDDQEEEDDDEESSAGRGVYLPETLEAAVFLLSRLQSVMTRAWDPTEVSPAAAAAAAENDGGGAAAALGRPSAISSVASEYGGSVVPGSSEEDGEEKDVLADTFIGSTRRLRKWDWVRCSHAPINPVVAAGGGRGSGGSGGGGGVQPVVAPVAIDPTFCHRTLRPGKPGPEGCTLEQV